MIKNLFNPENHNGKSSSAMPGINDVETCFSTVFYVKKLKINLSHE